MWWGAQGVLSGSVTVGQLTAFPMFYRVCFNLWRMLADKFNTLQMGLVAGEEVAKYLTNPQRESKSTQFDHKRKVSIMAMWCLAMSISVIKMINPY